ncbi:hypothetical protein GCM10023191_039120 [Actinoallomurus oryzae]|uniref:Sulfotransferase family protein n=1 Tax=Actinoallomurus oryzae TaxID=502180 RepID=A0ABP8Q2T4_9ACTN
MSSDDLQVAPGTRLLHIGPHKTGTTALQSALHTARERLADHGVLFPGTGRHPMAAVHAVIGRPPLLGHSRPNLDAWDGLVEEVAGAGADRAVVSSEFFADGDDDAVPRIVEDLGGPNVHVVVTLRPLAKILPSQWQQYVQNGLRMRYDAWLDTMFNKPPHTGPTPTFWRRHRHDELIGRWTSVVGPANLTVVVVDQSRPEMLLRTFESLLGVPEGILVAERSLTNRSLTSGEAELVRLLNKEFRRRKWPEKVYPRFIRYGAIAQMRASHEPLPEEHRITTPAWALERAAEIGAEAAEAITRLGVRVVGDLSSLGRTPPGDARPPAATGTPLVSPDAACQAIIGAIAASGAAEGTPAVEDLQVRDADAATLVRVLKNRGLRRARRSLRRGR